MALYPLNKKPNWSEIRELLEKERIKHPEDFESTLKFDIEYEPEETGGRGGNVKVSRSIAFEFGFRKIAPIGMFIGGSCLLIIQMFFQ